MDALFQASQFVPERLEFAEAVHMGESPGGTASLKPPPRAISGQSRLLKGVLTVMRVAEMVPVSVTETLPSVL